MPMLNDMELSDAAKLSDPGCDCEATSIYSTCDAEFCRYMNMPSTTSSNAPYTGTQCATTSDAISTACAQ